MQFEEMNKAVEANDIKPVIDQKVFKLEEAKEAYQASLSPTSKDECALLIVCTVPMGSEALCEGLHQYRVRWY